MALCDAKNFDAVKNQAVNSRPDFRANARTDGTAHAHILWVATLAR
jgi:hypothetical protein